MITVISGTNRPNSATRKVANYYYEQLLDRAVPAQFWSLEDLSADLLHPLMYEGADYQSASLSAWQDLYLINAERWVIVSPEYNGSYPGILKLLLDACSIRQYKDTFSGRRVALVGVSDGRAGNLRGMDHLSGVLSHTGAFVMPQHLPISQVKQVLDATGRVTHADTEKAIARHIDLLLAF